MKTLLQHWLIGSSLLLLITGTPCAASQFEAGAKTDLTRPVTGDFYAGSGTVTVNARIDGDLVAAGGTILVNDITVLGFIGDDVRAFGGTITLSRNVSGDVLLMGGELTVDRDAIISGDLIVAGGKAILNGTVKGKVRLTGGEIQLKGITEGDLEAKGGKLVVNGLVMGKASLSAQELTIGDQAKFYQDVAYWQPAGQIDFGSKVDGEARFDPTLATNLDQPNWYFLGFGSFIVALIYLSAVLLLLFLFEYLAPQWLKKAGKNVHEDITGSLGRGILYLLGVPALAIVLLITLIGIPVGLFMLMLYGFSLAFAHVISSLVLVNWYNQRYGREWSRGQLVWAGLALFIPVKLVTMIPVVGWLISILLVGAAFGAIIGSIRQKPVAMAA
jgi:hypothetical protein